jgi:hypothetical protein
MQICYNEFFCIAKIFLLKFILPPLGEDETTEVFFIYRKMRVCELQVN